MSSAPDFDGDYTLDHKYTRETGRIYITGVQALVRLPLVQRMRDSAAGHDTAGFISGYRGSPLGTYDLALWQAKSVLEQRNVRFEPGLNEDIAATAVWGSQQAGLLGHAKQDGVFAIWYGKGPGVDRSCDALKHGNYAGAAPLGGVLVLCGDDPGAKSSSIAHQSEQALVHLGMPILNPSSVQDYLDFGIYGWALSRYSGSWVGMKCLTDTVESSASVHVGHDRVQVVTPDDFPMPEGGLNIGFITGGLLAIEERLYHRRLPAVQAFVRANGLDRRPIDSPRKRLGIVTTGKAYLDVRQALDELGIDEQKAHELGLSIYKVALTWPLEPQGAREFARGMEELLVVEEKRPLVEDQLARVLYDLEPRPRLLGKRDVDGSPLVSDVGELTPGSVEQALRRWLERAAPDLVSPRKRAEVVQLPTISQGSLARRPAFCSGCPHNTSTVVPEGSFAFGGIGCHGMVAWMPERRTVSSTHMGGEGATWIGLSPFVDLPHIFQNMGDGTYFHSGYLCIRANVAAGTNITYKILVNGAVAMTGGQPIEGQPMDGAITSPEIARQLDAEGVKKIVIVSDEPDKYPRGSLPPGCEVYHRDRLDFVQRLLRPLPGVTAIVYDQTCAAEARRLRKRGEFPDPDRRTVINERVCEGCGDCSVQSNCISVEPAESEFGRKRRINQSSCNKDFSCVKGHCPSFLSVYGGELRVAASDAADTGGDAIFADLPLPQTPSIDEPFNLLVTGIGGTGVITVGALLGMAAHLEGQGVTVLDVTGLAQKNGPVTSHLRVAHDPEALHATRIASGSADLVLGCDIVVASSPENLEKMSPGRTTVIANDHVAPTADFAGNPDLDMSSKGMEVAITAAAGEDQCHFVSATALATALMGDAIATNLFLVGYAFQRGRLPVSLGALERAVELNGRQVEMNKRALAWGRLAAHDPARVQEIARPLLHGATDPTAGLLQSRDEILDHRSAELHRYSGRGMVRRYRKLVGQVAERERQLASNDETLSTAVARYFFKLLAVKDEYEVARLWTDGEFQHQLEQQFTGDYRISLHLAPPRIPLVDRFLRRADPDTGRTKKIDFGPWFFHVLKAMARLKFLRGTALDLFTTPHRRLERSLADEYEQRVEYLLGSLSKDNYALAVEIASIPEHIRGFEDVKERHLAEARDKERELLEAFRLHTPGAAA
ncbi:MAG: indolepyruvate ferredoxin oxidoreductase family protein [Myxococcota bacterium]|nr:indolepyruvate ferredoxin oxidoreductase family protein [Myxococcota bacterium]